MKVSAPLSMTSIMEGWRNLIMGRMFKSWRKTKQKKQLERKIWQYGIGFAKKRYKTRTMSKMGLQTLWRIFANNFLRIYLKSRCIKKAYNSFFKTFLSFSFGTFQKYLRKFPLFLMRKKNTWSLKERCHAIAIFQLTLQFSVHFCALSQVSAYLSRRWQREGDLPSPALANRPRQSPRENQSKILHRRTGQLNSSH